MQLSGSDINELMDGVEPDTLEETYRLQVWDEIEK